MSETRTIQNKIWTFARNCLFYATTGIMKKFAKKLKNKFENKLRTSLH